jgi:predicted hotdog family 3-hydroxylacyl-ACP dehydratase
MCLLDEVTGWDTERISCRTSTHRAADNPLRAHGQLGIACGIEYAAQAMAAHGALLGGGALPAAAPAAAASAAAESAAVTSARSGSPAMALAGAGSPAAGSPAAGSPAAGFLVGVRDLLMYASRLDDVPGYLVCEAVRVAGDSGTAVYEFELRSQANKLLRGRATVLFDAGGRVHRP